MSSVALTGEDTILINGRVITDLADGEVSALTFPNDIANLKTGKGGNAIYALNSTGRESALTLRVIRGSEDDKYLNGLLQLQIADFSGFILMTGEIVKQLGDGAGVKTNDTYINSGGIFQKQVEVKNNIEGETEQAVAIYMMKFANSPRALT